MLYSPRRVVTAAASASILVGSIVLAGCSSGTNATITHNPPLSTFGGKSTARSAVQSAILVAQVSSGIAIAGGPVPAAVSRRVLDMMRGRTVSAATGACVLGHRSSQVTNTLGTTTTTDIYYDALCTTLEEEEIVNIDSTTGATTSGTGSITTYDRTGAATSYHKLTLSSTNSSTSQVVTYNDAASASFGGTVIAAVGATCTGAPHSPAMTCTAATYGTASTGTFGQSLIYTGTAGTGGANNTGTMNVTFVGSGITGISNTSTGWTVLGTSGFNAGTGTFSYAGSSGSFSNPTGIGTFSLSDTLYTYTVTGNLTATGLAITIVRNTEPIAGTTIDEAGNGVITYADGTTDVVWANVVGV